MTHCQTEQTVEKASTLRFRVYRGAFLAVVFITLACLAWRLWSQNMLSPEKAIEAVRAYPVLSPFLFIALYALAMFFVIPTLPLNIGAGLLWGSLLGGIYTVLGSTIGGCFAFLFARSAFGQPLARSFQFRILKSLVHAVSESGWKVVAFARLNPVVPTGAVNFLFGLTSLRFGTFLWGSLLFSFPMAWAFAYLGASTGSLILQGDVAVLLRVLGITLVIGLLIVLGKRALPGGSGSASLSADKEP